jgi:hypothetical protein
VNRPVLCTPLHVEQAVLRRAGRSMRLVRTGMGPRRASTTAAALLVGTAPILVAGVGGGLAPQVRSGDVVVASEVRNGDRGSAAYGSSVEVPSAPLLAGALQRLGLTVHIGPVSSVSRIAWAPAADGPLAVDMESVQLAAPGVPFAVVRAIVDSTDHPLWHIGTLRRGVTAHSLRLMEVAEREGVPARLIDDVSEIDLRWLVGTTRLGITAGACAPPHLVEQIVHCLGGLGTVGVSQSQLVDEDLTLALPQEAI